ncbi:MAG: ATP--guanido phosphotransferase [Clostridia bacterium]|nr:ATP--guanido phosphotransferase [Clostridia bacterium]
MLWYEYNNKSVAVSTRVRLARNLADVPFPSKLKREEYIATNIMIAEQILSCNLDGIKLRRIDMTSLGSVETYAMVERHCISPKFAADKDGRILLMSDDESVSIMIGEEDHLRIQVLKVGENLEEAYSICDMIDSAIGKKLKFAFDERLGYLTECPTNLGTGMRASLMLHLPVLKASGELSGISRSCSRFGLTFRGFYGEGSKSKADIYQLSNQVTLGVSEKECISNLKNVASQIISRENSALANIDRDRLEDKVCRAFGILKYSRRLTTEEMMQHVTSLLLGVRSEVIMLPESISPMNIFITMQPAMINRIKGEISPNERDSFRADSIRKLLSTVEI